ncbi:hypothetical protein PRIPAC_78955 [Pristionchus pacificus]|nr:hypothetical protein PRIPAC_78955 [Pristionchus pacificus]
MDNRSCLICTVPIKVTHLGIEACRACAAFFKRTVIAGRKFTCRQGGKQCEIRKHEKYMCRSCRYDRCLKIGMNYALPPKKKPRKESSKEQQPNKDSNTNSNKESTTSRQIVEVKAPIVDISSPSTSSSTTRPSSATVGAPRDSLIDRMEAEYKASFDRRLVLEKEYVASHNLQRYDHHSEELYVANFTSFYELFRIAINDSTGLLQKVIDDFDSFPIDHRVTLFKNFVSKFSMIECIYYSTRIFKDSPNMFMASLITCADMTKMEHWMEDDANFAKNDAFRSTVRGYTSEYSELFGAMAKMDDLTEREFYALSILNYCDVDTSLHLPEEIIASARAIRAKVFGELQDYYRNELKVHDFSKRLGNLMMLAHGAGETGVLMNEEMRMYATMFDVYADDKLFREFFSE